MKVDHPTQCPYCGGSIRGPLVDWEASSQEDETNRTILTEYQCEESECSISFWV
jgi:hypothetical protein